jgi:excisionase family DNA binding protein
VSNETSSFISLEGFSPVLTVMELAAVLRISRSKAYELVAQRVIPSVRVGRCIRISRAALEEYLALQSNLAEAHTSAKAAHTGRRAG